MVEQFDQSTHTSKKLASRFPEYLRRP